MTDITLKELRQWAFDEFSTALGPSFGRRRCLVVDPGLFDSRKTHVRALELFAEASSLRDALGWDSPQAVIPLPHGTGDGLTKDVGSADSLDDDIAAVSNDELTADLLVAAAKENVHPVFLIRPGRIDVALDVARAIRRWQRIVDKLHAQVLTVHLQSRVTRQVLTDEGVLRWTTLKNVPLGFLPIDSDLLVIDWPTAHPEVLLDGNNSSIQAAAAAVVDFCKKLGVHLGRVSSVGHQSFLCDSLIADCLGGDAVSMKPDLRKFSCFDPEAVFSDSKADSPPKPSTSSKIETAHLVIVDRSIDLVTPLLTQWTYEGLLDETFQMTNCILDLAIPRLESETASMISSALAGAANAQELRWKLGSWDSFFADLRDLNFWAAANVLGSVANKVRAYYNARPGEKTTGLEQVKDYVQNLPVYNADHKAVSIHTALAAEVSARTFENADFKRRYELERELLEGGSPSAKRLFISDCIARKDPLDLVLRLCSLWSVTGGGIEGDKYDFLRAEILATYGIDQLPFLSRLAEARLFERNDANRKTHDLGTHRLGDHSEKAPETLRQYSWNFSRAYLKLANNYDPDRASDTDPSAAYSGYIPLSAKIIDLLFSPRGWSGLPSNQAGQSVIPPGHAFRDRYIRESTKHRTLIILYLGGITRAECTVLRRLFSLMKANDGPKDMFVLSTSVISGDAYVQSMNHQK